MTRSTSSLWFGAGPTTYDLYVRLRPDVALKADGVRSTNQKFRNEIEKILDLIIPKYVDPDKLVELRGFRHHRRLRLGPSARNDCAARWAMNKPEPKAITYAPTLWDFDA